MIKDLHAAVEKIKTLSEDRRLYAAEVLEQIAASGDQVYHLSDEERLAIQEGLAELDAGLVVSDADMAAFWDRHRN